MAKALMIPSMLLLLTKSISVIIGLRLLSVLFADSVTSFILVVLTAVFICKRVLNIKSIRNIRNGHLDS